jgi:hypothetical protein
MENETAAEELPEMTPEEKVEFTRKAEYESISDPIFFQWQREEKTKEEWLAAVQAINDANPYPVKEKTTKK